LFNQKIPIDIQISLRLKINKPNQSYTIVNEYIPTYQILLLAPTLMFAEKIQAALTRSKPRDFYDIYFLLKNGLFTATEKSQLASIKTTLITKKVKFADELAHFLPKSMKALANSFPEPLLVELNKYL
jgi:predicted nucleotidyltransferase component of viral defense system